MTAALPSTLCGLRDRALLLVGFAGAFRRSELVGLNWEDIEFAKPGLVIGIRRSKTDPEGQGREIAIPYGRRDQASGVDRHGNINRTPLRPGGRPRPGSGF